MARKRQAAAASGATVLVVDDQQEVLTSVQLLLEREGHRVLLAESGAQALEIFGQETVDLMLVDYCMPRMTGEEVVAAVRKIDRDVQIVLQTGYAGEKPPRDMLRQLAIQGYHDKTDGPDRLLLWVDVALKAHTQIRQIREVESLKSQILNNVSHEFRTPLHIVLGYTELLREEASPDAGDTLERIRNSAESLLDLVNDFLRLSELDMGRLRTESAPLASTMLADDVRQVAATQIGKKALALVCEVPSALPAVLVDRTNLQVMLRNLLSNAAKFAATGAITVAARHAGDAVVITVRDEGVGIAPEHHERIFEPFFQVEGGITRKRDGAGVGLTIARRLARLMGGDLVVESELGSGAAFALTLPCASASVAADVFDAVAL